MNNDASKPDRYYRRIDHDFVVSGVQPGPPTDKSILKSHHPIASFQRASLVDILSSICLFTIGLGFIAFGLFGLTYIIFFASAVISPTIRGFEFWYTVLITIFDPRDGLLVTLTCILSITLGITLLWKSIVMRYGLE